MATKFSVVTKVGDGTTVTFNIAFPSGYMDQSHVTCRVGSEVDGLGDPVFRALTWITEGQVTVDGAPAGVGVILEFRRTTPIALPIVDYVDDTILNEENLDTSFEQCIKSLQEAADTIGVLTDAEVTLLEIEAVAAATLVTQSEIETLFGDHPVYGTIAEVSAHTPTVAPQTVFIDGDAATNRPLAEYALAPSEPGHEGKFSMVLSGGATVWYELASNPVTPQHFGAVGGYDPVNAVGTDDTVALDAAVAYCMLRKTVLHLNTYYMHTGTLILDNPITIYGDGRESTGIFMAIDRTMEGINVLSSEVHMRDFAVYATIPEIIQNGQGSYGTCVTYGKTFYGQMADPLVVPDLVKGCTFVRMAAIRPLGSAPAHAIACMGRISGIHFEDVDICGSDYASRHGDAFLVHWGTTGDDFPVDGNGDLIVPIVLQKHPSANTYHPNGIYINNVRVRQTGRIAAVSSSYNVHMSNIDMDGHADGNNGNAVQLIDLVVGDESDEYAHPDDAGKVYSNITFENISAINLSGSGVNGLSAIDWSGTSTSKYIDNPVTGARWQRQPIWRNILFKGIRADSVVGGDLEEMINVRNIRGSATFEHIDMYAAPGINGYKLQQNNGQILFSNCKTNGEIFISDCFGFSFENCEFEGSQYPLYSVTVADTTGYLVGEYVDDVAGSNRGFVREVASATVLRVQAENGWADYNLATNLVGELSATSSNISAVSTFSNSQVEVTGSLTTTTTTTAITAGDTVLNVVGFDKDIKIGDKIKYAGGVVYAREYATALTTAIEVTPAPVAGISGVTLTVERRTEGLLFSHCVIRGASRGLDTEFATMVRLIGSTVTQTGHYGVLVGAESALIAEDCVFSDNGKRRLISFDAALGTRDVASSPDAMLRIRNSVFEDSDLCEWNIVNNTTADPGYVRDSLQMGSPITGWVSNGSGNFIEDNNRNSVGTVI